MDIERLDHLVFTVKDIEASCFFYQKVLGMDIVDFGGGKALSFGVQKINLHQKGEEYEPSGLLPTPGSADLCFITSVTISEVIAHLNSCGIRIIACPVRRTGVLEPIISVYLRDPDQNLVEVSNCRDAEHNSRSGQE